MLKKELADKIEPALAAIDERLARGDVSGPV
jgi:hypothetical protein